MKKNEKIFVGILAITAVIIIVVLLIVKNAGNREPQIEEENKAEEEFVQVLEDGTRLNTSEQMKKTKTIDGVEISDIQVTEKDNVTLILGTATNVSGVRTEAIPIKVTVLDKNGNEIITIRALVGELEPGESDQFNTSASFDFGNAYDFIVSKAEE